MQIYLYAPVFSRRFLFAQTAFPGLICLSSMYFSVIINDTARGYSAVGSAPEWHSGGQGFNSP